MASFRQFLLRIATLFRSGRAERDLDREIDSHLALLEDEFIAKGMAAADAKLAARRAFGGVDQTKERQRDARAFRWLADVPRDLSYALRSLRKNRAFTAAAVLTLAIGIGATTAIYSVVDTVLLRPLPFPDPGQIVFFMSSGRQNVFGNPGASPAKFAHFAQQTTVTQDATAYRTNVVNYTGGAFPEQLQAGQVSANYFKLFGATVFRDRTFSPEEDRPGGPRGPGPVPQAGAGQGPGGVRPER